MNTVYTPFLVAGQTVHRIAFDPTTFCPADMLWLPHHARLAHAAPKRQAEHLAGRIAAAHALRELNVTTVPDIGKSGEPLWPVGVVGSISHTDRCALAVVSHHTQGPMGIDGERILDAHEAEEIKEGIIDTQEEALLRCTGLPFSLALTLVFSAKESLFKALFPQVNAYMGFDSARITALDDETLTLALTRPQATWATGATFTLHWLRDEELIITLLSGSLAAGR